MKFRPRILLLVLATAPSSASAAATAVSVDFNARGRPISPLIFGVSFGSAARNAMAYTGTAIPNATKPAVMSGRVDAPICARWLMASSIGE